MNKYYTPEIEEFYVGFEYYTTTHPVSMEEFSPYVKGEFDHNTFEREFNIDTDSSGEIIKIGVPSCIKVKYLDRDCIESLDWDHDYNAEPIPNREELPVFEGYLFDKQNETGELWILYHFSDNVVWIEYIKDCGGQGYVFKGEIKNKSELKRLMQWLKIS